MLQFFKRRHSKEKNSLFLENGHKLLEGLASASNYRYDLPYRNFTVKELVDATNNFNTIVMDDGTGTLFRGSFQNRQILVKRSHDRMPGKELHSYINHDMVISLMMSHHKNVLKFLGCCLELYAPALVYESTGHDRLLSDVLLDRKENPSKQNDRSLSWKSRLKVATDAANALVYLHTEFNTPIIHRDFSIKNIILDHFGVAKLLNFSLCISLPPGETQVEDRVIWSIGYSDPEYMTTGIVTEKSDVYMLGVLLLQLLTGRSSYDLYSELYLVDHVKDHAENGWLNKALDNLIVNEKEEAIEQQLRAVTELALRCTLPKGEDRPDMLDVARELSGIERSGRLC